MEENALKKEIIEKRTKNNHNKIDIKTIKDNTICSLKDVEYFLNKFTYCYKYIKLIKLLK